MRWREAGKKVNGTEGDMVGKKEGRREARVGEEVEGKGREERKEIRRTRRRRRRGREERCGNW